MWQEIKRIAEPISLKVNESRLEIIVRSRHPARNADQSLKLTAKNELIYNTSSSQIMLRGWESVETFRGQALHFLVLDEVAKMKGFNIGYKEVIIPTLTDHAARVLFLSTPNGFDHFYDLYNAENTNDDYKSFHFTTYDNPHISEEEINKLKNTMSDDEFYQEYMADFRKRTGLVYKEFNRDKHVFDPNTDERFKNARFVQAFLGVDFGWTNPSAVLLIKKDSDANYWITDELYETQLTNTQLINHIQNKPFNVTNLVYPDPAEPDRIEEMKRAGLYPRPVKKGKGSIENGIQRLQELIKCGRIKVSRKCNNLITEFETYSYPEKSINHNESELPIAENDHLLDSARYSITSVDPDSFSYGRNPIGGHKHAHSVDFLERASQSIKKGFKKIV